MDPEVRRALDELADVRRRMAEIERVWAAGDADRHIGVGDFARQINRSERTVLRWWRTFDQRRKWHLEEVLERDPSGRLFTTPRKVHRWKAATAERLRATGVHPLAEPRGPKGDTGRRLNAGRGRAAGSYAEKEGRC